MSEWIQLEEKELEGVDPGSREDLGGIVINLFMSPYDVPQAVRGRYDKNSKKFKIEFKYISDEPVETEHPDEILAFEVGKHSGRLYAIIVDADKINADQIAFKLQFATEELGKKLALMTEPSIEKHRIANYRAAQEALVLKKDRLIQSLSAT